MSGPRPERTQPPQEGTPVVELRGIGKSFPGVRALHDVSLAITAGEVLGLVGENGAGKSTLIKILGGVYPSGSFEGDVIVDGRPRAFRSTRDARTAGIAVVHQELALIPEMSVADNLVLGREPTRFGIVDRARTEAMARDMLRAVLGDEAATIDLARPAGHLGVGVQQILEIARALADAAKVIVLDEPTAALTDGEIARLFALIRARRAAGASFIYISHRLDEIAALSDRVAVMRDGELVGIRPAARAAHDELVSMMTGKELGDVHARRATGATLGAAMLEVERLTVAHPVLAGRTVVDDLSFTVHAGEVVALAGAMGAGRTATLSALFGVARSAVTGTLRVAGAVVAMRSPAIAIAAGLAYVPEDRKASGLVLGASVGDNLALAALPRLSRFGIVDDARAEQAALTHVRDLTIKAPGLGAEVATLSGGNQQKVVIGKWLELAPRVLLLDEPTRGVDVGAKAEIYKLIEQLTARGHAVLLASSDLPEVVRLADRVLVLREGRLAGTLARADVTQLAIMRLAIGTDASGAEAATATATDTATEAGTVTATDTATATGTATATDTATATGTATATTAATATETATATATATATEAATATATEAATATETDTDTDTATATDTDTDTATTAASTTATATTAATATASTTATAAAAAFAVVTDPYATRIDDAGTPLPPLPPTTARRAALRPTSTVDDDATPLPPPPPIDPTDDVAEGSV